MSEIPTTQTAIAYDKQNGELQYKANTLSVLLNARAQSDLSHPRLASQ